MYLAIADEEINREQEKIHAECQKMIADFDALPFWKQWGNRESLRIEITLKWKRFERWMEIRMKMMKPEAPTVQGEGNK